MLKGVVQPVEQSGHFKLISCFTVHLISSIGSVGRLKKLVVRNFLDCKLWTLDSKTETLQIYRGHNIIYDRKRLGYKQQTQIHVTKMKESICTFQFLPALGGCLNFKWTLLSSLIYKNTYHAQFHTVIPGDSIFLQSFFRGFYTSSKQGRNVQQMQWKILRLNWIQTLCILHQKILMKAETGDYVPDWKLSSIQLGSFMCLKRLQECENMCVSQCSNQCKA